MAVPVRQVLMWIQNVFVLPNIHLLEFARQIFLRLGIGRCSDVSVKSEMLQSLLPCGINSWKPTSVVLYRGTFIVHPQRTFFPDSPPPKKSSTPLQIPVIKFDSCCCCGLLILSASLQSHGKSFEKYMVVPLVPRGSFKPFLYDQFQYWDLCGWFLGYFTAYSSNYLLLLKCSSTISQINETAEWLLNV